MAVSKTFICNLALGWVSGNRIEDFENDDSVEAQLCRENYDSARKAVLEDVRWTFADARKIIPKLVELPEFGYAHQYELPNDCLRVLWASDRPDWEERRQNFLRWKREGGVILADSGDQLYILYTADITDVTKFTESFVHALAGRMAADFAIPIAQSRTLQNDMWQYYTLKKEDAAGSDGQQGRNERFRRKTLINVR